MKMTKRDKMYLDKIKFRYCEKFRIAEIEYCQAQFEYGLKWLKKNNLPDKISYSAGFWAWFRLRITDEAERCIIGEIALSESNLMFSMPLDITMKVQRETGLNLAQTQKPQTGIREDWYLKYLKMENQYLREIDSLLVRIRELEKQQKF